MHIKKLLVLLFSTCLLNSPSVFAEICPDGTWNRNQSTAYGGGLSTAHGGGMSTAYGGGASTAHGGGMSTAYGGGMSTAHGGGLSTAYGGGLSTGNKPYCTNRPHLHTLIKMGIIDSNYNLL